MPFSDSSLQDIYDHIISFSVWLSKGELVISSQKGIFFSCKDTVDIQLDVKSNKQNCLCVIMFSSL